MADVIDKRYLTKHGFPKGFRFAPTHLELITILSFRIHGHRLHPKVDAIFHDLDILKHHPEELHDEYERDKEDRYIYFFSRRQKQAGAAAGGGPPDHKKRHRGGAGGGQDDDDNEPRPVRLAKGGGWKPSGGGLVLRWPKDKQGGFVAGKMVTMVFYDHRGSEQVKSHWGMHEFTVPLDPRLISKPAKNTRWHELALYRLYKLNSHDMECNDGSNQTLANVAAAAAAAAADTGRHFSAPCPAGQPSFGVFTGRNQTLDAGPSTSRMPPPLPLPPQHHIPNAGHPQYYQHHHQNGNGFGAARASAAHQQVRTMMTMPPAYGTGMLPGRQVFPFARPPGTVLPGRQSLQFTRPPLPPAAVNLASSHRQATPKAATYGGAGQEASHSGATRSPLPSAPVLSTPPPPPPAAQSPSAGELAPMTVATHGGASEQEAGGDFGATWSRLAEQDATAATAEPGQDVQFADCVKPEEIEDRIPADNYDEIGMPDWEGMFLNDDEERFQFTMDELCGTFDDLPPTQEGDNN